MTLDNTSALSTQHPIFLFEIRSGAYYDSVILMQLQKDLAALDNVVDAGVVMATPANKEVLEASGLLVTEAAKAKNDDLLIVVKAYDQESAENALAAVDGLLQRKRSSGGGTKFRPKSLANAVKMLDSAEWVLISVPGRFAAGVADEALDLGKNVMLYSDNVSLEDEVKLKQKATEKELLVMGPDCGTAIINGVGLAFANRVNRGSIGVVGASGTGIQAVTSLIHQYGGGISQAIGTGGRDLKEGVGGLTMLQGLAWLGQDSDTNTILIVSKPPSPQIAQKILSAASQIDKPVVVHFIGHTPPAEYVGNITFSQSLHDAVGRAISADGDRPDRSVFKKRSGYLRGLFSGGTLAYEAVLMAQATLSPLFTNVVVGSAENLPDVHQSQGHTIIDMGEDVFTQGRLHPMMDNDLRIRRLRQEGADPEVGVILLDVVLGEGSHHDPASELAPEIAAIKRERDVEVVVILLGTDLDPQDHDQQKVAFEAAGAFVTNNVLTAIENIVHMLTRLEDGATPPQFSSQNSVSVINVGLESFYDSIIDQGGKAIHVDWKPPASGNEKMMALLAKLKGK